MKIYSDKLKNLRTKRGWTQQQVADLTDLSLRTIQRIEKTGLISNESLGALCSVFEVKNTEILNLEEEQLVKNIQHQEKKVSFYVTHVIALFLGTVIGVAITASYLV